MKKKVFCAICFKLPSAVYLPLPAKQTIPDSKVHGANMGPIWGRQGPGGPHVGPMNFAIWDRNLVVFDKTCTSVELYFTNEISSKYIFHW